MHLLRMMSNYAKKIIADTGFWIGYFEERDGERAGERRRSWPGRAGSRIPGTADPEHHPGR
jgi:hypothetical protein